MNVTKAIKRLGKLKQYKKYANLDPKVITLAQEILVRDLIGNIDEDEIRVDINEETIDISKILLGILPVVWIEISMFPLDEANVKLQHWLELDEAISKNYRMPTYSLENSHLRIINACSFFNSICGKVDENKKKILTKLKRDLGLTDFMKKY